MPEEKTHQTDYSDDLWESSHSYSDSCVFTFRSASASQTCTLILKFTKRKKQRVWIERAPGLWRLVFPLVKHLKLFPLGEKNHRERRVREPGGDGDLSEPSVFRQGADSEDSWSGRKMFIKPDTPDSEVW